jgi:hypothetical protein
MGEETGRKSPLRHVKAIVLLAVILAISLTPAITLRFFPRETSAYMLEPLWAILGPRIGFPRESIAAIWIVISFLLAVLSASALLLVLARSFADYGRGSG